MPRDKIVLEYTTETNLITWILKAREPLWLWSKEQTKDTRGPQRMCVVSSTCWKKQGNGFSHRASRKKMKAALPKS